MKVIGLTGPARSGKDTVAQMILKSVPGAVRQGFADKLKVSAALALGFDGTPAELVELMDRLKVHGEISVDGDHGQGLLLKKVSGREYLQRYGTEAHRDTFGDDFWLDATLPEGRDDAPLLVVSDVRFENEAQRIIERGGEVWRVTRPGVDAANGHASEAGIPPALIRWTLRNDRTLAALGDSVQYVLRRSGLLSYRAGLGVPPRTRPLPRAA